jgi:hypothetical protein
MARRLYYEAHVQRAFRTVWPTPQPETWELVENLAEYQACQGELSDRTRHILFSMPWNNAWGCLVIKDFERMPDASLREILTYAYLSKAGWRAWLGWQSLRSIHFAPVSYFQIAMLGWC